ncbi:MAG: T9SS type A sorting domain-containing protein [Bacteroidales bacterium]|nr:T9SS type A sorting domain-containing protein [Bacteroidales bacterium]
MKKILLSLAALLLGLCAYAQSGCEVMSSDYHRLELSFKASSALNVENVIVKGNDFSMVTMEGFGQSSAMGCPSLPTMRCMIEAPLCSGISVRITSENHIVIDGESIGVTNRVAPVQPSECKTASRNHDILALDQQVYGTDAFYGIDIVSTEHIGIARDRNLAQVVFSPVQYNPVTNQFLVYTQVEAVLTYENADVEATKQMKRRYYSPAFGNGINTINSLGSAKNPSETAPIRYLVIANTMFRGELDEFVNWKKRTGFIVDEVYTDDAEMGDSLESIMAYVKRQYTEATAENPAPTFVLFVGDVDQLPTTIKMDIVDYWGFFQDTTIQASDLNYACWTDGDNIPDCYYGRLSAQTVDQLTPQLDKILMYERYEFPDPSFLDVAVLVAGQDQGRSGDNGYKVCDPTMDYIAKFYINGDYGYSNVYEYKNNTSINPNATNVTLGTNTTSDAAAIRARYSEGAGWINYSAHGDWDRWHGPELTTSQVAQMTNKDKCGIMIGNCCLSGKFDETTCFAESLKRKDNNCGAAAYIGASNSTYWNQDFYWAIGVRSSISANMNHQYMADNLGLYDRLFHTHGEDYSLWAVTLGSMMFNGNMAVENSNSEASDKLYYWEIYHTFGDPSMMPWLTQAEDMTVTYDGVYSGSSSVTVTCVPYAYVALTGEENYNLYGAAFADENGVAVIDLAQPLPLGSYVLAATAQNYKPALVDVVVSDVTYTITVLSDNETMGSVYGSGTYSELSTAVISASSHAGYHFVRWNDNDLNATRTVVVTADSTFTAYFEVNDPDDTYYTLTVLSADETMGTASGSGQYLENSSVTISANPLAGYRFVRWDDNNTQAIRQVTVSSDASYTAYFERMPQGIDEVSSVKVKLYPNPTTGILNIELDGLKKVEVIDAVGRVVMTQGAGNSINMSSLVNGIYTVRLFSDGAVTVKKVVKK